MISPDLLKLVQPAIAQFESLFGWTVLIDAKVLEECGKKTVETLGKLNGVPTPNALKTAGHLAFWIRKLKPFSLYNRQEQLKLLKGLGVKNPESVLPSGSSPSGFAAMTINELIAISVACGVVEQFHLPKVSLSPSASLVNDLAVGLRYHSYSPSSLAILFEAMV